MSFIGIVIVALGLSMDTFAVAIAAAGRLDALAPRPMFRLAFHFGLFQAVMPVLGWLAGVQIARAVDGWDHWVAFGLLTYLGVKAVYEALVAAESALRRNDPTRGLTMISLALATSLDAFAVGVSLAMLQVSIWHASLTIGCMTATLTILGMLLGSRLGRQFGAKFEALGGLALIAIAFKILAQQ